MIIFVKILIFNEGVFLKNDIKTGEDVFLLVSTFYEKVRKDVILAAFFNNIKDRMSICKD